MVRFEEADAGGAVQTSRTLTSAGEPVGEPRTSRSRWEEYQRHASFPVSATSVRRQELDAPLGRLRCLVYEVDEGASITTFWFAVDRPGMPVRVETRRDDEVTYIMEMIGDSIGY